MTSSDGRWLKLMLTMHTANVSFNRNICEYPVRSALVCVFLCVRLGCRGELQ